MIRDAAVVLNVLRTQHRADDMPCGVIMRHFEVPGAGGFLLSTWSPDAEALFPSGHSGTYFRTADECLEMCERFIRDAGGRAEMIERSHENVARNHRYTNRAIEILRLVETITS